MSDLCGCACCLPNANFVQLTLKKRHKDGARNIHPVFIIRELDELAIERGFNERDRRSTCILSAMDPPAALVKPELPM